MHAKLADREKLLVDNLVAAPALRARYGPCLRAGVISAERNLARAVPTSCR